MLVKINQINNLIKRLNTSKSTVILLSLYSVLASLTSFLLTYKKFLNFEFGKFDLGNMAQIIWNSSRGNFFEVTDQFGSNMSRLGMSHFDPILLLLTPLFWVSSDPMIIVYVQHIVLWSAVIPIFFLTKKYTKSNILPWVVVLIYSLQPALGYLLVWTEIHGLTIAAGLFIWYFWHLEKNEYTLKTKRQLIISILLLILILMGKEEIGAMTGLFALYIFLKNKKLGVITFLISVLWFGISFFVLIPAYSGVRDASINNFFQSINYENPKPQDAAGDNFFYLRYSYLGANYQEMLLNLITKPYLYFEIINTDQNLKTLLNLFGPFAFLSFLSPLWLIALPDYLISLLSIDPLFSITNHRISFIFIAVFISFLFTIKFLAMRKSKYAKSYSWSFIAISLILSIYFSFSTQNPLLLPVINRLKIDVPSTYAKDSKNYEIGKVYKSEKPDNSIYCLKTVSNIIKAKNPSHYTGPDYLGAHTSLRRVNALFPTALNGADLFVVDFYEDKSYEPLNAVNTWTVNKDILEDTLKQGTYNHGISCGRMILFEKGTLTDTNYLIDSDGEELLPIKYKEIGLNFRLDQIPNKENNYRVKYTVNRLPDINLSDKVFYWRIIDKKTGEEHYFIDYAVLGLNQDLSGVKRDKAMVVERDFGFLISRLNLNGQIDVFYGISNQINSGSMYLGVWEL